MKCIAGTALLLLIGLATTTVQPAFAQTDPMLPTSSGADAIASPLAAVTILSNNLESSRAFYEGALSMTATPISLGSSEARRLAQFWGLPQVSDVEGFIFATPSAPGSGIVRVLQAPRLATAE